jgi:hypothetical protein
MSRRLAPLLASALLLAAAVFVFLRTRSASGPPALERPSQSEPRTVAPPRPDLEAPAERAGAVEPAPAPPPAAPEPPEDLRAEGARRGWQLPVGKGWWLDTLINPGGADPSGPQIEALQEQVLGWGDRILSWKLKRKERMDAYCQERIAAGLAVQDPKPDDVLPASHEHVIVTTHTLQAPNQVWRVDVGPGDDAELDLFERQIASTWCDAVADLRRSFAALKR